MTNKMKVYQELASSIDARRNCIVDNNTEWITKHEARVHELEDNYLPSGSGIDNGCQVDLEASTTDEIVIQVPYHHMDENGFYAGWTDYEVTITPSLINDIDVEVIGGNGDDFMTGMTQSHISERFYDALRKEVTNESRYK